MTAGTAAGAGDGLSEAERAIDQLLTEAHLLAPYQLPVLVAQQAELLGAADATIFLVDLQQQVLLPLLADDRPADGEAVLPQAVDSTLAGRAYQQVSVLVRDLPGGGRQVWLPMLDGAERLGALTVTVRDAGALETNSGALLVRLKRLAALTAELVMTKTMYGDTLVRARRRAQMGLAAELQWSLLPPLTFACREVTIAAALEPAYEVAGDTVDYAVDAGIAHVAVFDGMGHGLQSAQLAALTVAAYRNARRAGRGLVDIARAIDDALLAGFAGEAFATAVVATLDTVSGELSWISAGHPEPLLLRDGKLVKTLHTAPAPPFGLGHILVGTPGGPSDFSVGVEQLEPGDRVLLYTDGVTEARSPEGEFFGVEKLTELLTLHLAGGLPTPETMRRLVHGLLAHQQGQLSDDATLVLLEWPSGNEQALLS